MTVQTTAPADTTDGAAVVAAADDAQAAVAADDTTTDDTKPGKPTFTAEQQAHIDEIIRREKGKAAKAADRAAADRAAEQARLAALPEQEKAAEERRQLEARATAAEARAVTVARNTAITLAAIGAGVDPAKADRFLRLAGTMDVAVEVNDDGVPDSKAVKALVDATLAEFPEIRSAGLKPGVKANSGDTTGTATREKPRTLEDALAAHYGSKR